MRYFFRKKLLTDILGGGRFQNASTHFTPLKNKFLSRNLDRTCLKCLIFRKNMEKSL